MRRILGMIAGILLALQITGSDAAAEALQEPVIESGSAAVMDAGTGEILFEKNGSQEEYPASITKLLTSLVVMDECELSDIVIFSHDAVYDVEEGSGNSIQLEAGDKLTVEECLYATLLESSNQAANALAEHVAGSLEAFAIYMESKLDELGCRNSHFVNPSGLPDAEQSTTAEDMALIAKAFFDNEELLNICSASEYQLPATLNNPDGYLLHMEHQMVQDGGESLQSYELAGKTGYTSEAGNTLVTRAEKDGQALIAVVLQSEQTHYADTAKLFQYGFSYLESRGPVPAETAAPIAEATAAGETAATEEASAEPKSESALAEEAEGISIHWVGTVFAGVLLAAILYGFWLYVKYKRLRQKRLRARRRRAMEARGRARRGRYA